MIISQQKSTVGSKATRRTISRSFHPPNSCDHHDITENIIQRYRRSIGWEEWIQYNLLYSLLSRFNAQSFLVIFSFAETPEVLTNQTWIRKIESFGIKLWYTERGERLLLFLKKSIVIAAELKQLLLLRNAWICQAFSLFKSGINLTYPHP